jgi:hypothetical protein
MRISTKHMTLSLSLLLGLAAHAADLNPPAQVTAGTAFSMAGTGSGTFYLIGPSHVLKRELKSGQEIRIEADDVRTASRYLAIACVSHNCSSASFYVVPAEADRLSFLLHPSRVPVAAGDAINATAFVFDKFRNLILKPVPVAFHVTPKTGPSFTKKVASARGAAWMKMASTPKEGPVKVTATVDSAAEPRIIQQVASDACNLRIRASRTAKGVLIETEPVRDCSGNPVPDGTIVSFTAVDSKGKTTVDAPIKKGIARTELPLSGSVRVSVASGVVIGNEITVGGRS